MRYHRWKKKVSLVQHYLAFRQEELGQRYIILDGAVQCLAEMTAEDYQQLIAQSIVYHDSREDFPLAWDTWSKWYIVTEIMANPAIKRKPVIYTNREDAEEALAQGSEEQKGHRYQPCPISRRGTQH